MKSRTTFFRGLVQWLKSLLDPLEVLYLAIAIATFTHTMWATAFLFEGAEPTDDVARNAWFLSGALIAAAVDLGMLVTSRLMQNSKDWKQTLALIGSFLIAAAISFYSQAVYIAYHTPVVTISPGVNAYWRTVLQPLIDARVMLLPLALPVLASIFSLARVFHRHDAVKADIEEKEGMMEIASSRVTIERTREALQLTVGKARNAEQPELTALMRLVRDFQRGAEADKHEIERGYWVDTRHLTWHDPEAQRTYGSYKNPGTLLASISMHRKKRMEEAIKAMSLLSAKVDDEPETDVQGEESGIQ